MTNHIELFKPDDDKRTAFNSAVMNEIIQAVNVLLNIKVPHGKVTYSDSNVIIELSGSAGTGGGGGGGTTNNFYTGGDSWL